MDSIRIARDVLTTLATNVVARCRDWFHPLTADNTVPRFRAWWRR
jgi:hypothetical protein